MSDKHPFYRLYESVPRQGPGSTEDTLRAWRALAPPASARVLELGCGSGGATRALLGHTDATVTAIDQHGPFLEQLATWAETNGVNGRLTTVQGDMADPPAPQDEYDVVWSEGAAYAIGFEQALLQWRRHLRSDGRVGISELVWRVDEPSEDARGFWQAEYAEMSTADERRQLVRTCGYRHVGDFFISADSWWDGYFRPLLARVESMVAESPDDEAVAMVAQAVRAEAQAYRQHRESFGYLFLLLAKA